MPEYKIKLGYADGSTEKLRLDVEKKLTWITPPKTLTAHSRARLTSLISDICGWLELNGGAKVEVKEE